MALKELQTYDDEQVTQRLKSELPAWSLEKGTIRRKYKTGGWPHTLMVVNAVGYVAEAAFHHSDLSGGWAEVTVKLSTHSAKGITDNDFELAKRIEDAVTWLPDDNDSLDGFEKGFKKKWTR
ncbi:MAG: 4a-hydroxytetrahydrobiopterin dehydratase [Phycisphaeraceae bacterium]|nr:4a-hydroxytetrahydrobiopterin dehydratase [Phycisphaeraceae bacterium]